MTNGWQVINTFVQQPYMCLGDSTRHGAESTVDHLGLKRDNIFNYKYKDKTKHSYSLKISKVILKYFSEFIFL